MSSRAAAVGAVLVTVASSCGSEPLLDLQLTFPAGPDPLADVTRLRLLVSNPQSERWQDLPRGAPTVALEQTIEPGSAAASVVLEGYDGETLRARGELPPLFLQPVDDRIALLVGPAGQLVPLRAHLVQPVIDPAAVLLPSSGLLLAGGEGAPGVPIAATQIYQLFSHELVEAPALPTPRAGAVGATCGDSCAVLALGRDDRGLATELLRFDGAGWQAFDDGLAPEQRRSDAVALALADGSTLVVGGTGSVGALRSLLLLLPGGDDAPPTLTPLAFEALAARRSPAAAVAADAVLLAGGQGEGEARAELLNLTDRRTRPVDLADSLLAQGAAAVSLGGETVALLGGRDDGGGLLADGWLVDTRSGTATHVPGALSAGRAGHHALLVGGEVVVVGGEGDGPLPAIEVLAVDGLVRRHSAEVAGERRGSVVRNIGPGSFLLFGGAGPQGPLDRIDVYQTAVPDGQGAVASAIASPATR